VLRPSIRTSFEGKFVKRHCEEVPVRISLNSSVCTCKDVSVVNSSLIRRIAGVLTIALVGSLAWSPVATSSEGSFSSHLAPRIGSACSGKEVDSVVQTKRMRKAGYWMVCSMLEDPDHDPHGSEDGKSFEKDAEEPSYVWSVRTPASLGALVRGKELDLDLNKPRLSVDLSLKPRKYDLSANDSCRLGDIDKLERQNQTTDTLIPQGDRMTMGFGEAGKNGRDRSGFPSSLGEFKIGFVIQVPKDARLNGGATEEWMIPAEGSQGSYVVTRDSVVEAIDRAVVEGFAPYFREQSYYQMNVTHAVYPTTVQASDGTATITYVRGGQPGELTREFSSSLSDWKTEKANRVRGAHQFLTELPLNAWSSDFQDVDVVWFVQVGRFPGAWHWTSGWGFNGGEIQTSAGQGPTLKGSIFSSERFLQGGQLHPNNIPTAVHEIGHSLRLPDQYTPASDDPYARFVGRVGIMGRGDQPGGFLGWERYIQRWLDDSRVTCITPQMLTELARNNRSMTVQLAPIQQFPFFDTKNRLAVIKINDNRAFVVESWRPRGTDRALHIESQAALGSEGRVANGTLVYFVDAVPAGSNSAYRTADVTPMGGAPSALWRSNEETVLSGPSDPAVLVDVQNDAFLWTGSQATTEDAEATIRIPIDPQRIEGPSPSINDAPITLCRPQTLNLKVTLIDARENQDQVRLEPQVVTGPVGPC
jgi:M6 family metalloprotease-like protein